MVVCRVFFNFATKFEFVTDSCSSCSTCATGSVLAVCRPLRARSIRHRGAATIPQTCKPAVARPPWLRAGWALSLRIADPEVSPWECHMDYFGGISMSGRDYHPRGQRRPHVWKPVSMAPWQLRTTRLIGSAAAGGIDPVNYAVTYWYLKHLWTWFMTDW